MRVLISTMLLSGTLLLADATVEQAVNNVVKSNAKGAQTQLRINQLDEEKRRAFDEYLLVEQELKEQRLYNAQLRQITAHQSEEIPRLKKELQDVEVTKKRILPLMYEMVTTLKKLVQLDTPFLKDERTKCVEHLEQYLVNPDISLSEQYRIIVQSYKIEYNYARTLEVYRAELHTESSEHQSVDFLRVGRVGFYYQSLDGSQSAIYNPQTQQWVVLDARYNALLKQAIRIARKKVAPDFLTLPLISKKEK